MLHKEVLSLDSEDLREVRLTSKVIAAKTRNDLVSPRWYISLMKDGHKTVLVKNWSRISIEEWRCPLSKAVCSGEVELIVPKLLRPMLLLDLHNEHIGAVRMKGFARQHFWWSKLTKALKILANCAGVVKKMLHYLLSCLLELAFRALEKITLCWTVHEQYVLDCDWSVFKMVGNIPNENCPVQPYSNWGSCLLHLVFRSTLSRTMVPNSQVLNLSGRMAFDIHELLQETRLLTVSQNVMLGSSRSRWRRWWMMQVL